MILCTREFYIFSAENKPLLFTVDVDPLGWAVIKFSHPVLKKRYNEDTWTTALRYYSLEPNEEWMIVDKKLDYGEFLTEEDRDEIWNKAEGMDK